MAEQDPLRTQKRGNPTSRRRRQVWWARRIRRFGLAWQNALEIARAGRLTAPYGAPFEVVHEEKVYRLRRYEKTPDPDAVPVGAPLLLIPPLMVASEVYDISPDVSAIAFLSRKGVDVWLCDFGAPEREEDGMDRTLDDHVRAVSDAIDRVRTATGKDVHLAGYSQGGMFCYQAAAFRRSAGIASVITMGSPVDLHRTVKLGEDTTERLVAGLRAALSWPMSRMEGLSGMFTSTGFKLLSARKEVTQLIDFVRNLHDREALEKREAKRLFLGGQGFVAWPGPAFRKFVDELIVGNRMQSGGFVIDGHTVTLADLTSPILYFVGSRDEMGRPAAVRGIRRASPKVDVMYEVPLKAGHFGLVVGSTALGITWPSVIEWMRWREDAGPAPQHGFDVRAGGTPDPFARQATPEEDEDEDATEDEHGGFDLELAKEILEKGVKIGIERLAELSEDLGSYLDNARWQLPRLNKLRNLQDDSLISMGRSLSDQARSIGDRTFFLFRGRAFTYAESNRRVDAVVRGLLASGIQPGQRVGVMMKSRPSHLSVTAAINRLGAISVLLSPDTADSMIARCLELGEAELVIVDPDNAARVRAAIRSKVLVLGGVGEVPWTPGQPRVLPDNVVDMEAIDPDQVALPSWYKPDPGRARDLAMVFVTAGTHEPPRATRITNRRWAFSALGAAAAATLTTRDTVYCCLPLHHPSGMLVATGSALIGGARLALASKPPRASGDVDPQSFWEEIRRYGASVVYYAGEMCRKLVDAQPVLGEKNNPVRLFAGSGLRRDVWRRLIDRFGPVGVLEFYASTEANTVLANARGKKIGSAGRPLPFSPEVVVAAWEFETDGFSRDGAGHLLRARLDEPGMLIAKLAADRADVAHIDPKRLLRDAFEPGDLWFVTGDLFEVDVEGDFTFVDRQGQMIETHLGAVATARIEDAIYGTGVALCAAAASVDPDHPGKSHAVVAVQLHRNAELDLGALSAAVASLPEYARPRRLAIVDDIPLTDGFRAIKRGIRELVMTAKQAYAWDARAQRFVPALEVIRAS